MILSRLVEGQDLMVHTVGGELRSDELLEALARLYAEESLPSRHIWDLTGLSDSGITLDRMRRVQGRIAALAAGRTGGRAALVAPDDLIFALGRQYSTLAETAGLLFTPRPFRTMEEACAWLGVDPDSLP